MKLEPSPSFFSAETQMWIHYGGKSCIVCKHEYNSGEDMHERDITRATERPEFEIACRQCFDLAKPFLSLG